MNHPNLHSIPITIYTADTDVTGVVYHANYLTYFEQCRSHWLAHLGLPFHQLIAEGTLFAVKKIDIQYLVPLRLGQTALSTASITHNKPCSTLFHQTLINPDDHAQTYCKADVLIACLDADFKPKKLHPTLRGLQP